YGWNNTDVATHGAASDGLSGVDATASDLAHRFTAEGAGQSYTFTAVDLAGNAASATISGINIDKTAPTLHGAPDGAPAATGWYNIATGAPNVNFTGSDHLSGLVSAPPAAVPVGEGANQAISATVSDLAGNSASVTVGPLNVDVTAPTLGAISV